MPAPEQPLSSDEPLRAALVALPWSRADRPSPALAALTAYVRQKRPAVEVRGFFEFLPVCDRVGRDLYHLIAEDCYVAGELLFLPFLYPERRAPVRDAFLRWAAEKAATNPELAGVDPGAWFEEIQETLHASLEALATELAGFTLVGLTTCFGQLFANVALARRLKALRPDVRVVLGGSTISSRVGPSILREYACIDFIIQGEGELPFVALLDHLASGSASPPAFPGILSHEQPEAPPERPEFSEVLHLDELPLPDYDEFARAADEFGFDWTLAIEGSRGCWWDRGRRTGNPRSTCYFCNLNVQWSGYREKTPDRVIAEVRELSDRYSNLKLFFADNIIRHHELRAFAEGLKQLDRHFEIFHEMRASVRPIEFLLMWEAGLESVQFGIEGLSTAFLQRIGKGTAAIQNLQAMKLCAEFHVSNQANLIVDFPGATQEEVRETCDTLLHYGLGFEPLSVVPFYLGVDSTVERLAPQFGVTNVRNFDALRPGLPEDVFARVHLLGLSFDVAGPAADWTPLGDAVQQWMRLHAEKGKEPLLVYRDGGEYLIVEDRRFGALRQGRFSRLERDVYLYCTEIRSLAQIQERFAPQGVSDGELLEMLQRFQEFHILYAEGGKYLSLAMASSPRLAAHRIRTLDEESRAVPHKRRKAAGAPGAGTVLQNT